MAGTERSFVTRHSRLQDVSGLDGLRLHLSDDVFSVWHAVQLASRDPDAPIPYWAFAWGGGLAVAHYLREHPDVVYGRRVLDMASGSGLDAIAAMQAGAAEATAADIDPFAIAAIALNARANRVHIDVLHTDILDNELPDVDVILAGDCWYEETFATRVTAWLQRASQSGVDVLIGDPGRRYLAHADLEKLATYEVRSTTDLEDMARTTASVFRIGRPN